MDESVIAEFEWLIESIAKKFYRRVPSHLRISFDQEDLLQIGRVAIWKAKPPATFKPQYVRTVITRGIIDYLRKATNSRRITPAPRVISLDSLTHRDEGHDLTLEDKRSHQDLTDIERALVLMASLEKDSLSLMDMAHYLHRAGITNFVYPPQWIAGFLRKLRKEGVLPTI